MGGLEIDLCPWWALSALSLYKVEPDQEAGGENVAIGLKRLF